MRSNLILPELVHKHLQSISWCWIHVDRNGRLIDPKVLRSRCLDKEGNSIVKTLILTGVKRNATFRRRIGEERRIGKKHKRSKDRWPTPHAYLVERTSLLHLYLSNPVPSENMVTRMQNSRVVVNEIKIQCDTNEKAVEEADMADVEWLIRSPICRRPESRVIIVSIG